MRGQVHFDWTLHEDEKAPDATFPAAEERSERRRTWPVMLTMAALLLASSYWVGRQVIQRAEGNLNAVQSDLNNAVMAEQYKAEEHMTEQRLLERAGQPSQGSQNRRPRVTPPAALVDSVAAGPGTAMTTSAPSGVTPVDTGPEGTIGRHLPAQPASTVAAAPPPAPEGAAGRRQGGDPSASVEDFELFDELALVDVYVAHPAKPWHTAPYHVTQVYLENEQGWTLTAPITELWGTRQRLDTHYFNVLYGARNAAAVDELVAELDSLYLRLYRELGLVPPRQTRLTIEIDVSGSKLHDVTDIRYSGDKLIVPPPELLPRPENISPSEALYDAVAFPLAVRVFSDASDNFIIPCEWVSMHNGIGLWQRWDDHRLPSRRQWEYRQDIERWLGREGAPELDDLTSVALDCWRRPPYIEEDPHPNRRDVPRTELASTFIAFAVAEDSYRVVPRILAAFVRHNEWETLIPDIFDRPAAEIEREWQEYVRRHYGAR